MGIDSLQGSQVNSESLEEEYGNRNISRGVGSMILLSTKKVNSKEESLFWRKDLEEKTVMG